MTPLAARSKVRALRPIALLTIVSAAPWAVADQPRARPSASAPALAAEPQPSATGPSPREKPRLLVLTDISNEPDDEESLVRLLVYANEFDIEGLVATTSTHLRSGLRPDLIRHAIGAYGQVRDNLAKHADGFPAAATLAGMVKSGNDGFGLQAVGDDKSSEGARHIIEVVDAAVARGDKRPLWVAVWGGANTLAQALYEVRKNRTREAIDAFVARLRVYSISDQDDAGSWLRKSFQHLYYVVTPSLVGGADYFEGAWSGISGDRHYRNGPMIDFHLVDNPWLKQNIIENHGPLGALYPPLEFIMEGDTPSFMNLLGNGLGAEQHPEWGGWGGRYKLRMTYGETRPIYTNTRDTVVGGPSRAGGGRQEYVSAQATVWRWRRAFQHDFAARMDWCVAETWKAANHNPRVVLNGQSGTSPVLQPATPGETLTLSAAGSQDPDGHRIRYRWFVYPEAGSLDPSDMQSVALRDESRAEASLIIPGTKNEGTVHVILEVQDNGEPALYSYRRLIVDVRPTAVVRPSP